MKAGADPPAASAYPAFTETVHMDKMMSYFDKDWVRRYSATDEGNVVFNRCFEQGRWNKGLTEKDTLNAYADTCVLDHIQSLPREQIKNLYNGRTKDGTKSLF